MNLNKKYKDVMDSTRFVVPVSTNGNQVVCKVYFKETENTPLVYTGTTTVSVNLFYGTKLDANLANRIGFVLLEQDSINNTNM